MINAKAQRKKIQVWLQYRAYKRTIDIKMSFGADCEMLHRN